MPKKSNSDYCDDILVTVITAAYNSDYIMESINSVLNQTYSKIQYIIIDDGSQYFSMSKVEKFIEINKRYNLVGYIILQNDKNIGTVKTLNKGIKLSKGEYIFNLAADDVFMNNDVIKGWVSKFKKERVQILTGIRVVYDITLNNMKCILPTADEIKILESGDSRKVFKRLLKSNFILGCCTAMSKELINEIGLYDEEYFLLEDYPLMLKLSRKGIKIGFWNQPVVKYRLGGVSTPEKFNPIYQHDSKLVLEKEILPYVRHPFYARVLYTKWEIMHKEHGNFMHLYSQIKIRNQNYLIPILYLRYPLSFVRNVKNKAKSHFINR